MARTARGISWVYSTWNRESPGQDIGAKGTITIEIENGAVIDVRGIPENYRYKVLDRDLDCIKGEPIPETLYTLYLATMNVLVRAKSSYHAAEIIRHILSEYDVDDGTLVNWDYAVQDGKRQCPKQIKHINLDLEPESIAELLGLI